MIKAIKEKLKNDKKLYVIYRALKYKEYSEYCFDYYKNGQIFRFQKYGEEYPGKNIYYIHEGSSAQGFFSILTWTLRRLEVAEKFGFTPVVTWDVDSPVNANQHPNPFLLYFSPVSEIDYQLAEKGDSVAYARQFDCAYGSPAGSYEFTQDEIRRLAKIFGKYINIRPDVMQQLNKDITALVDFNCEKVLGVHVRGADWRKVQLKGHPIAFTEQDYLDAASDIMENNSYDKVFLATDSESTISLFREKFGDKLVMFSALRTQEGDSSLVIFDKNNDAFQMSYEVLRDAYTLASCESLLCGLSYVSYIARIMKQSTGLGFTELRVLDKGKAQNGISLQEAERKQRK